MGRTSLVPAVLKTRPFTLSEARKAGLERWHLEGSSWTHVARGTYAWSGLAADALHKLEAARLRLPASTAFSGLTAAWLHGLDVEPCDPIEVTIPKEEGVSGRVGVVVRRAPLPNGDVTTVRDFRATSSIRTVGEVCSRLSLVEAVVVADLALHSELVTLTQLQAWAATHSGRRGIKRLRQVLELAEPATESPMESRLRMALVLGGLPRPQVQVKLYNDAGQFVGRPDLYYEHCKLGIEYDGAGHRTSLDDDNRRQNRLLDIGVRLLRFTGSDLSKPDAIVALVRAQTMPSAGNRGLGRRFKTANAGTRPRK